MNYFNNQRMQMQMMQNYRNNLNMMIPNDMQFQMGGYYNMQNLQNMNNFNKKRKKK